MIAAAAAAVDGVEVVVANATPFKKNKLASP